MKMEKLYRFSHDNKEGKIVLAHEKITPDTCIHDAKVKMG